MSAIAKTAPIAGAVLKLMADGQPREADKIAEALGLRPKTVRQYMRRASEPGHSKRFHVVDHKGVRGAPRYKKLAVMDDGERDDAYRSRGEGWPAADVVVQRSFDAMVRMGARA